MPHSAVDERVTGLEDEIVAYLKKHPRAADTLDGIISWWLPRQRYETAYDLVSKAVNHLVKSGVLEPIKGRSSKVLYKLKPH